MSDKFVRSTFLAAGASISLMAFAWTKPALAQDDFCTFQVMPRALRQTILVIDSAVIQPEVKGDEMSSANKGWRDFVREYVDARSPDIAIRLDPRERVTVMVANADGAGATQVFSGCIPVFSAEEDAQMRSEDTALDVFLGKGWQTRHEDMSKNVVRHAQRGMSEMTRTPGAQAVGETDFAKSGLVRSLQRAQSPDLVNGVPRVLVYTDLSRYVFPEGSMPGLRNAAFADAKTAGLSLGRAEMHLVSVAEPQSSGAEHYLRAFFLGSEARLVSQSTARGRMQPSYPVADVAVFSGAINYGDLGDFPVRMRLVRDVNGSTTNSWFEEVGKEATFVPVEGQLSCGDGACEFTQTQNFAQMWASDPNAETPECGDQIAFLGMRMLNFETDGETLTGKIHDTVCYLPGFEDGIPFELKAVENGRW